MKNVDITTFNVGQGLFNLVTGIKDDETFYSAVFDCGNFQEYNNSNCIDQACAILNSSPNFEFIDDVVISHQDEDHWRNFIEFILKLNNLNKDDNVWYRLPRSSGLTYMINFSDKYINECEFVKEIDAAYVIHLVNTYLNNIYVLSKCNVYDEAHFNKSYWQTLFSIDRNPFAAKIAATEVENIFLISITGSEPLPVFSSEIQQGLIYMISQCTIPYVSTNIETIYALLQTALGLYHYNLDDYKGIFNQSPVITKYINNLFLGGLDCNSPYETFKGIIKKFSINYNNASAFAKFLPDTDLHFKNLNFIFEQDAVNHKGKPLDSKGSTYKNATSQITALNINSNDMILFPGDSTFHAFKSILDRLDADDILLLFIAPHHGSYKTNFSFTVNSDKHINLSAEQPIKKLLTAHPPCNIYISAEHNKFGHPSESFIDVCEEVCADNAVSHKVLFCPDSNSETFNLTTDKAIFSTESTGNLVIHFPPPPQDLKPSLALSQPVQLPDNSFFIPYGDFNL